MLNSPVGDYGVMRKAPPSRLPEEIKLPAFITINQSVGADDARAALLTVLYGNLKSDDIVNKIEVTKTDPGFYRVELIIKRK